MSEFRVKISKVDGERVMVLMDQSLILGFSNCNSNESSIKLEISDSDYNSTARISKVTTSMCRDVFDDYDTVDCSKMSDDGSVDTDVTVFLGDVSSDGSDMTNVITVDGIAAKNGADEVEEFVDGELPYEVKEFVDDNEVPYAYFFDTAVDDTKEVPIKVLRKRGRPCKEEMSQETSQETFSNNKMNLRKIR
jgi:hypothetical protein